MGIEKVELGTQGVMYRDIVSSWEKWALSPSRVQKAYATDTV